jgi:predicted metal-dependent phosphoesterase TrpH
MTRVYDLHTHSTASDGAYTPAELVRQAAEAGITDLALTDHDTVDGLQEASVEAARLGIRLIPAVEVSAGWQRKSIHVVGLGIDPEHGGLRSGLDGIAQIRRVRAQEIGRRLAKCGIADCHEAVLAGAGQGMVTRAHFARHLFERGEVATVQDAFDRYLGRGKPAYVPTEWTPLAEAVAWIRAAGGVAVLAHPQRYKLSGSWMRRLLQEFCGCGGQAMEVVTGNGAPQDIDVAAQQARRFGLLASVGSDFHTPDHYWIKLGRLPALPAGVEPVWSLWHG